MFGLLTLQLCSFFLYTFRTKGSSRVLWINKVYWLYKRVQLINWQVQEPPVVSKCLLCHSFLCCFTAQFPHISIERNSIKLCSLFKMQVMKRSPGNHTGIKGLNMRNYHCVPQLCLISNLEAEECYSLGAVLERLTCKVYICIKKKKNLSDQVEKALQLFEYSALSFFTLHSHSSEKSRSTFQTTWTMENGAGSGEEVHAMFFFRCSDFGIFSTGFDRWNKFLAIPRQAPNHQFLETSFASVFAHVNVWVKTHKYLTLHAAKDSRYSDNIVDLICSDFNQWYNLFQEQDVCATSLPLPVLSWQVGRTWLVRKGNTLRERWHLLKINPKNIATWLLLTNTRSSD